MKVSRHEQNRFAEGQQDPPIPSAVFGFRAHSDAGLPFEPLHRENVRAVREVKICELCGEPFIRTTPQAVLQGIPSGTKSGQKYCFKSCCRSSFLPTEPKDHGVVSRASKSANRSFDNLQIAINRLSAITQPSPNTVRTPVAKRAAKHGATRRAASSERRPDAGTTIRRVVEKSRIRTVQQRECERKARFATRVLADKVAKQSRRRHHGAQKPPIVYLCPIGKDHWHIGGAPKPKAARKVKPVLHLHNEEE